MKSRSARAARGSAIAGFAAFTAALAHTVGGGQAPGPIAIVLALAFSAPLAMLLAGARFRLLATTVSAVATQAALHLLYAVGVGGSGSGASAVLTDASHASHAGHPGSATLVLAGGGGATASGLDHGHALMPFAHLAAALLTIVALALADRAFDAIARIVRVVVARLVTVRIPLAPLPAPLRMPADRPAPPLHEALLDTLLRFRGPPVTVVSAS